MSGFGSKSSGVQFRSLPKVHPGPEKLPLKNFNRNLYIATKCFSYDKMAFFVQRKKDLPKKIHSALIVDDHTIIQCGVSPAAIKFTD